MFLAQPHLNHSCLAPPLSCCLASCHTHSPVLPCALVRNELCTLPVIYCAGGIVFQRG